MADLYPNVRFPSLDFSVLGDLPKTIEEAQGTRALKEGLAGIKSMDAPELEAAATRIMNKPGASTAAIEHAMRLQAMAVARRTADQRAVADQVTLEWIKAHPGGIQPPATPETPTLTFGTPPAGAGRTSQPVPPGGVQFGPPGNYGNPLAAPGPQSALPLPPPEQVALSAPPPAPAPPITPPPTPPPTPLPPVNQTLAGPGPVPPPGPMPPRIQLAGPIPTPDTVGPPPPVAPPPAPPAPPMAGGLPPWLANARLNQAVTVPSVPSGPGPGAAESANLIPGIAKAKAEAEYYRQEISKLPRGMAHGEQARALQEGLHNALAAQKLDKDQIGWGQELAERAREGKGHISFKDYMAMQGNTEARLKEVENYAKETRDNVSKATALKQSLEQIQGIVANPRFISGPESERIGMYSNALGTFKSAVVALGVPENILPDISGLTSIGALQSAFDSIKRQAVLGKLGTFARGVSEGDRVYVNTMLPDLTMSKEGINLVTDIMLAAADREIAIGKKLNAYRQENHVRANAPDYLALQDELQNSGSIFKNPDGSPTALGAKVAAFGAVSPLEMAQRTGTAVAGAVGGLLPGGAPSGAAVAGPPGPPPEIAPPPAESIARQRGPGGVPSVPGAGTILPPSLNAPMQRSTADEMALAEGQVPFQNRGSFQRTRSANEMALAEGQRPRPRGPLAEDLALAGEIVTPQHEGQIYYGPDGKRAGIIRDGRPVPFRRLNR